MTEKSISSPDGIANLTVIRKNEKEQAKLIQLKKPEEKPKVLLPPQQHKYIKAKKHDFL